MTQAARYLVSAKNLIGCGLALVGLVPWLVTRQWYWLVIAVALYALGALIGPRRRPKVAKDDFDPRAIRQSLDHAYQMTHGRLPVDVQTRVARIRAEILDLLPHAAEFPVGSQDLFVLRRTAIDYLPRTIEAYLALPTAYATKQVVQDGKTPLQVVREQLELLDTQMGEIAEAVRQRDSDRLLANGRFLEERFGQTADGVSLPPRS
jgi:hypothetical protein